MTSFIFYHLGKTEIVNEFLCSLMASHSVQDFTLYGEYLCADPHHHIFSEVSM